LTLRIDDIDRSCGLTESQKKKLHLAGRGDITRFFDRVSEPSYGPAPTALDAGVLGEGSIFSKAIKKTLNEEQLATYEKTLEEKRAFRYRADVELAVAALANSLGMSALGRQRFVKLLLEETRPPKFFGSAENQVVMLQAAKLPEAKVRPIFDEAQWRVLSRSFARAIQMEQVLLRVNGYVPGDAETDSKPENPQGSKDE